MINDGRSPAKGVDLRLHRVDTQLGKKRGVARGLLGKPRKRHTVFGLECWTNRVQKECEVAIPWWGLETAKHATILTDRIEDLGVVIADHAIRLECSRQVNTHFSGREVRAYLFRAAVPAQNGRLMRLRLSAHKPWTLYGISLTP